MHLVDDSESPPVTSTEELVRYFFEASKPRDQWRVGTENEMIGAYTGAPGTTLGGVPPYAGPRGIRAVLDSMASLGGWKPVLDRDNVIALVLDDAQITIEPGGQLEYAGPPFEHTADYVESLGKVLDQLGECSRRFGLAWLSIGFRPFGRRDDVSYMPKGRYDVMRAYLPRKGQLAEEMMLRTATVQVNLDYGDGDDAREKLRCLMSVTSILTALYANSPIVDGEVSGYSSYRAEVWRHMDPDRCGLLPFAFEDGCMFARYTEWALDVPMFFIYRHGYRPVGGMTFRQFMTGGFEGERATLDDWTLHLSTLFPEARLKKFLEVRGCDAGSLGMIYALGPLCRGLLYDQTALAEATALTSSLDFPQRLKLQADVARHGLRAQVGDTGHTVGDLASELVTIAVDGLRRESPGEVPFLEPVLEIAETRRTQADAAAELWRAEPNPAARLSALAHPGLAGW